MQQTIAFAPTQDDLDEFFFDVPVITLCPRPDLGPRPDAAQVKDEREQPEPGPVQRVS